MTELPPLLSVLLRREINRHGVELLQNLAANVGGGGVAESGVRWDYDGDSLLVRLYPLRDDLSQLVHDARRNAVVFSGELRVELGLLVRGLRLRVLVFRRFLDEAPSSASSEAFRLSTYFCPALPGALASITRATSTTATSAKAGAARAHTNNSSAVTAFIKRIVFVILSKKIDGGGNGARSPEPPIRRQSTGDTA